MNQIQSDIHVEGKSFSDHCFANLSSGQQPNYYHSSPAVSGFTDCFLISSSCQNKGNPWPVTQVIGVEDSPDSDSDYDSGVIRLHQLGFNPIIHGDDDGSQYIYIKGSANNRESYESEHQRAYMLTLDKPTIWLPPDLASSAPTCYRAMDCHGNDFYASPRRNVWFITELIDYQCLDTDAITLSCIVASPFGRPVKEYRTVLGVLECLRDTIKALRSLYLDAKILDQDISDNNILISNAGNNNPDSPTGILIDFDNAIDVEIEPENPCSLSGTKTFMAIDLSRGSDDRKNDISNDNLAAILAEFRLGFKGLESLAHSLRNALFFPNGNEFFTGTSIDIRETEKLYSAMIGAFEKAVVEDRE
ncbi:hypothetical protein ACJA88_009088 [Fusarium oxysporum]